MFLNEDDVAVLVGSMDKDDDDEEYELDVVIPLKLPFWLLFLLLFPIFFHTITPTNPKPTIIDNIPTKKYKKINYLLHIHLLYFLTI